MCHDDHCHHYCCGSSASQVHSQFESIDSNMGDVGVGVGVGVGAPAMSVSYPSSFSSTRPPLFSGTYQYDGGGTEIHSVGDRGGLGINFPRGTSRGGEASSYDRMPFPGASLGRKVMGNDERAPLLGHTHVNYDENDVV